MIHNIKSICIYIEIKRKNIEIIAYPLSITIKEKIVHNTSYNIHKVYNLNTIQMIEDGIIEYGEVIKENVNDIIDNSFLLEH